MAEGGIVEGATTGSGTSGDFDISRFQQLLDKLEASKKRQQRQSIAQTRDFIYQSGITSLQGEIEKENRKIEIQGKKDVAKIDQATSMYSNLIGSFNF